MHENLKILFLKG